MNYGIIYKALNKVNHKPYIGQTTDPLNERISRHFYRGHIDKGKDNSIFHKALIKYGRENFDWVVICECSSKTELDEKETFYIKHFNSHYKDGRGYNMTYGGEGSSGFRHSEKSKKKMSLLARSRGPSPLKGKKRGPMPLEIRIKIAKSNRGKKVSKETRKKMRLANLGKHLSEKTKEKLRNRVFTDETRKKMSISRMGKSAWNKGLKIIPSNLWLQRQEESHSKTYEVNNNGEINVVKNLAKHCRSIKINKSSLLSAVKNGNKYRGIFVKKIL
jgi:group I intron endonuclease